MGFGQTDTLAALWGGLLAARRQGAWSQFAFAAHYIQHENCFALLPIEYAARRFNNLTVAAAAQFARFGAAVRVNSQLLDMPENSLDQFTSGRRIVERDVIGDGV